MTKQALGRLPYYAQSIARAKEKGSEFIAAPAIAAELQLNEVQVRKDLAAVSKHPGVPKKGFHVDQLLADINDAMGGNNYSGAILVGAGSLGHALLSYSGFDKFGMHILAAFDDNPELVGQEIHGKRVYPMEKLSEIVKSMRLQIGIITVPADGAQKVCDQLIDAGILAIWNFAPTHLNAPAHILIQSENMAASLVLLSQHLKERIREMT